MEGIQSGRMLQTLNSDWRIREVSEKTLRPSMTGGSLSVTWKALLDAPFEFSIFLHFINVETMTAAVSGVLNSMQFLPMQYSLVLVIEPTVVANGNVLVHLRLASHVVPIVKCVPSVWNVWWSLGFWLRGFFFSQVIPMRKFSCVCVLFWPWRFCNSRVLCLKETVAHSCSRNITRHACLLYLVWGAMPIL